jgi:uncharacterized membrane protein
VKTPSEDVPVDTGILVGLTFLSLAVRLPGLSVSGLWLDEALTAWRATSLSFTLGQNDGSPVFYPILVYLSTLILGESEFSLRLPGALAGSALAPCVYFFLRKRFESSVALVAGVLAAVSPYAVFYSREARPYSLSMLLCFLFAASVWLLLSGDESTSKWQKVAPTLFGIPLVLTHHYGLYVVAAVFLLVLPRMKLEETRQRVGKPLLAAYISMALIWLLTTAAHVAEGSQVVRLASQNNPFWPKLEPAMIINVFLTTPFMNCYPYEGVNPLYFLLGGATVLFSLALGSRREDPGRYWAWLYLLLIMFTILNDLRLPHFVARRYETGFIPVLLVVFAVAVYRSQPRWVGGLLSSLLAIHMLFGSLALLSVPEPGKSASLYYSQKIVEAKAEAVYVPLHRKFDPLLLPNLTYYLHHRFKTTIPVIELPRFVEVADGFVSPTHYYIQLPENAAIPQNVVLEKFQRALQDHQKVALAGPPEEVEVLAQVAERLGWRRVEESSNFGWRDGSARLIIIARGP